MPFYNVSVNFKFNLQIDGRKNIVVMAKFQSPTRAFQYLTLMGNCMKHVEKFPYWLI